MAAHEIDRLVAILREARLALSPMSFYDFALGLHKRFKLKNRFDEELVIIDATAAISASTSSYTASSTKYMVPGEMGLYIHELHGICALNAPTSETLAIAGLGNPSVGERIFMKAMNCRVTLRDIDEPRDITPDRTEVVLAPFVGAIGGKPLILPEGRPEFIPPGHNIQMTAKLKDTTASVVGGETLYGFLIVGKQVRLPGER